MNRRHLGCGLLTIAFIALAAGPAVADRTPMTRNAGLRTRGVKPDLTVPYTTNGESNFGVYQGVGPQIYRSPTVDDPKVPQSRPVFNLIFYGASQAFGDRSNGATSMPKPGRHTGVQLLP